jgi:MFS family permease
MRRWYVLGLLTAVYALNIADRFVISTLIEPIKAELNLSDASIGFLTGVALALFYVTVGLPLAVLADRTNRRNLIAVSLAAWSAMTALCGLTHSYSQLLFTRVGVGIGEAGGTPASNAIVSDYFPWRQRAFALSVFSLGASLGSMIGTSAGYASDAWGWRSAFLLLGIPGVALAGLLVTTVSEPQRGGLDQIAGPAAASLFDTFSYAARAPALAHCLAGGTIFTLWAWGLMWWTPSYLVRSHGMSLGDAGGALALMHGIGGTIVLLFTTVLMRRLQTRDARTVPWFITLVILTATIPSIIAFVARSTGVALAMLWVFIPLSYATFGPTFALLQNLVPAHMRSQAIALLLFFSNIANLVIAPQMIGIASDALATHYGTNSLRMALIPLAFAGVWAAWHYARCAGHLKAGLRLAGTLEDTAEPCSRRVERPPTGLR